MFKALFHVGIAALLSAAIVCTFGRASAQIAPGVLQSAAHTATITGTVTQSDGTPVAGANVQLNGPAILSTKSDAHGTFAFTSVPWGAYQIGATSELGTASRANVIVNGDINVAIQYSAQGGPKVIAHVSTSGAGAHINVTSSSIASISPSEYAFQGNGTWTQLFAQIPGVAASGLASGGNDEYVSAAGSPLAPVSLSLNGALPYETSTTLDGMPLQNTSASGQYSNQGGGVDLANMPLNAFDTADVVRGPGANAPSIADSIGGSFVLHTPGQVDVNHFEFSVSNDPYGGIVSNAKIALHLGRLSATFTYGVNTSPGPLGTSNVIPPDASTPATIGGQTVQGSTVYSGPSPVPNCNCTTTDTLFYCCVQQSTAWTAHNGAVALFYKFTPSISAGIFYGGSTSQQSIQHGYILTEFAPEATVPAYNGRFAPSPPGQTSYTLLDSFGPQLVTQSSSLLEEKVTAFIGRGVLRLAALQNNSFFYQNTSTSYPNGTYTLWGTADVGPTSPGTPTAYNGIPENLTFTPSATRESVWTNNRDLLGSYALQVGSASSVGISYTTSYYNAPYFYDYLSDNVAAYEASQNPSVSETTDEMRLHFDTEIGDKLSVGLSWYFANGRYHVPLSSSPDSYTDKTFPYSAPRFGAVWQAGHDVAIRAAVGGGYALPALYYLSTSALAFYGPCYYQTLANPNLKPEESFGFDVGTDVRFRRTTVLSLDLYRTNLYGQYYSSYTQSTLNGLPLYITEFGNLGTSRMEGINLDVHRDVTSGYYWHGTFGLTRGYVISVPSGFYNGFGCTKCINQAIIPGVNFNNAAGLATVPYASASLQIGYRWNPGKYVDLSSTYYGNNNIYNVPAFVELDAHAGYAITRNVTLLATFRNITGIYGQSILTAVPAYAVPVILGAPPNTFPGAAFAIPYGPRAVTMTADFKL